MAFATVASGHLAGDSISRDNLKCKYTQDRENKFLHIAKKNRRGVATIVSVENAGRYFKNFYCWKFLLFPLDPLDSITALVASHNCPRSSDEEFMPEVGRGR